MTNHRAGIGVVAVLISAVALVAATGQTDRQIKAVNWAEINPAFEGATAVNDRDVCLACHEDVMGAYQETAHGRMFQHSPRGALEAGDCETCHGPRSIHVDEPDDRFAFSDADYSTVCMQCHQDAGRLYWKNSQHAAGDVSCVSCHTVMEKRSHSALLSARDEFAVCGSCHTDVRAKMSRTSRHPVAEGGMTCSGCHDPHGAPGDGMLAAGGVAETCYGCHQDKRGPFLWEHAPVREDCLTCHEPHGSNNPSLLATQNASLCVSCHQYGGHINQYRYNRVSTPYGNGCVNCHVTIHGSNHPSGAKFNR